MQSVRIALQGRHLRHCRTNLCVPIAKRARVDNILRANAPQYQTLSAHRAQMERTKSPTPLRGRAAQHATRAYLENSKRAIARGRTISSAQIVTAAGTRTRRVLLECHAPRVQKRPQGNMCTQHAHYRPTQWFEIANLAHSRVTRNLEPPQHPAAATEIVRWEKGSSMLEQRRQMQRAPPASRECIKMKLGIEWGCASRVKQGGTKRVLANHRVSCALWGNTNLSLGNSNAHTLKRDNLLTKCLKRKL